MTGRAILHVSSCKNVEVLPLDLTKDYFDRRAKH